MVLFTTSVLKYFVNYPNLGVSVQFCMFQFLPVFTGFFHCPGKNTFCHGKNPTLIHSEPLADFYTFLYFLI